MLALQPPRVIDGAMATELGRRGVDIDQPLWSARALLVAPAVIEAVHRDYFAAGADIAITASYQCTFAGFAARGLDADATRAALRRSVELALGARRHWLEFGGAAPDRPLLVGASIGAFGAHRHDRSEYHGDYGVPARVLIEFHRRQLAVLAETAADFIAFETVPSLAEGEAIVRLLEEFPEVPAWLSFTCRDGSRLGHGERFGDAVALANERANIVAIGLNCTPPRYVEALLESAAGATSKPLLACPNAGDPDAGEDHVDLATLAPRWRQAGAGLIGGCCHTTPDDIRALAGVMSGG